MTISMLGLPVAIVSGVENMSEYQSIRRAGAVHMREMIPHLRQFQIQASYAGVGIGRSETPDARFLLLIFSLP